MEIHLSLEKHKQYSAKKPLIKRNKPFANKNNFNKKKQDYNRKLFPDTPVIPLEEYEMEDESIEKLNIEELNQKNIDELIQLVKNMELELDEDLTKQKIIYQIVEHSMTQKNIKVIAVGVLERMTEGYGFLRVPEYNYVPGTEDVYVSPSQIRVFKLKTGDTVLGEIRPPKATEKYFAMLKIYQINYIPVQEQKERVNFDSLTPCYPNYRLTMESEKEDLANRFIDLFFPYRERTARDDRLSP